MPYKDEDIIYILTKEDVDDVARELGMRKPSEEVYQSVRKYAEEAFGEGFPNWHDVLADGLAFAPKPSKNRSTGTKGVKPRR